MTYRSGHVPLNGSRQVSMSTPAFPRLSPVCFSHPPDETGRERQVQEGESAGQPERQKVASVCNPIRFQRRVLLHPPVRGHAVIRPLSE